MTCGNIENYIGTSRLPVDVLGLLFECHASDGILFHRPRTVEMFPSNSRIRQWDGRYAGKRALNDLGNHGYLCGDVMGKKVLAHRVIWAMHYGDWPEGQIDHINMDKTDNRIINLRDVAQSPNQWNRTKYKNNTSGFKGVSFYKRDGTWRAQITINGKKKTIGYYPNPEMAANAYDEYCLDVHGDYARTNKKAP